MAASPHWFFFHFPRLQRLSQVCFSTFYCSAFSGSSDWLVTAVWVEHTFSRFLFWFVKLYFSLDTWGSQQSAFDVWCRCSMVLLMSHCWQKKARERIPEDGLVLHFIVHMVDYWQPRALRVCGSVEKRQDFMSPKTLIPTVWGSLSNSQGMFIFMILLVPKYCWFQSLGT